MIKREAILVSKKPVSIWMLSGKITTHILTLVYEYRFFYFKWYRIKQIVPYIEKPFYDGEYSSNEKLMLIAKDEINLAKEWLIDYKKLK